MYTLCNLCAHRGMHRQGNAANMFESRWLLQLVVPDKWKEGSRNSDVGAGPSKRPLATNTLIKKKTGNPYGGKCELCKKPLHQAGKYCHGCAYSKGTFFPCRAGCLGCGDAAVPSRCSSHAAGPQCTRFFLFHATEALSKRTFTTEKVAAGDNPREDKQLKT